VEHPLIDLKLFKNATFLIGNLTGMLSYYVLFAIMFMMPFYLQKVLGYSITLTGFLLTPLLLTMAVAAPFSGYLSDKYGPRIMTTSGMLISALACLSLLFIGESVKIPILAGTMIFLGLGMGLFIPSNNSAIMGSAPTDKLGMAGGLLNMTRSLGLILGVDISGVIFTTLEHRYLAEKGYPNVQHIFSNASIPVPVKANAFMHGFVMVIIILLAVNIISSFLSAVRNNKKSGIIDHELAGTVIISSGFFSGFAQEARGISLFVTLLLFTGVVGVFAATRLGSEGSVVPQSVQSETVEAARCATEQSVPAAEKLAMAYYAKKYHDTDVRIEVRPSSDQMEADVIKNGMLVKRLSIEGTTVIEHRTGLRDWAFDLLSNVN